jgi:hypothetical protein
MLGKCSQEQKTEATKLKFAPVEPTPEKALLEYFAKPTLDLLKLSGFQQFQAIYLKLSQPQPLA